MKTLAALILAIAGVGPADEAANLYFRVLPVEATGLTCLFGLPTESQRARFEHVARRLSELADEAEAEVDEAILALESSPGFEDDPAARAKRRRLADEERDRRIPFLKGVGAVMEVHLEPTNTPERARLARLATQTLEPLVERLDGTLAIQAAVHAALARLALGEYEAARALLEPVLKDPTVADRDRLAAELTTLRVIAAELGPDAALTLIQQTSAPRDPLRAVLYALGLEPAAQRALVMQRLRLAVPAQADLDALPPMVTIARAEGLAAESPAEAVTLLEALMQRRALAARDRAETLYLLGRILLAEGRLVDATDRFAQLAAELPEMPQAVLAAELAAECAGAVYEGNTHDDMNRARYRSALERRLGTYRDLPDTDRWRCAAAELAVVEGRHANAETLYGEVDAGGRWGQEAAAGRVLALKSMAESESDPAERERILRDLLSRSASVRRTLEGESLARVHLAEVWAMVGQGRPRDALRHLDGLDTTVTALAAEALVIRIDALGALGNQVAIAEHLDTLLETAGNEAGSTLLSMLETRRRAIERLEAAGRADEALASARQTVLPVGEALDRWLAARPDDARDHALILAAADAYRLGDRCDRAGALYDTLLQREPDLLAALLGRAECLVTSGADLPEAMAIYRRIAETIDERHGETYWLAQLRMVQILDETGRHTDRIVPHIQQLRQKDPNLGGDRFRHAFDALERKHS
jgi:tetratricopeptide (TPR) repeat protein